MALNIAEIKALFKIIETAIDVLDTTGGGLAIDVLERLKKARREITAAELRALRGSIDGPEAYLGPETKKT